MRLPEKTYGYSRSHRMLELAGIVSLFSLLGFVAWRLIFGVTTTGEAIAVLSLILAGYFVADFISGLVHWAGDTLGSETMPIVGRHFIKPFRFHHVDQKDITRHDFTETNGNNCIVSVPLMLMVAIPMPRAPGFLFYFGALAFSVALFTLGTNQFHKWAHMQSTELGAVVRVLQRSGLILSPEHHLTHHTPPFSKYYCITTGMLNPLLTRTQFFRRAERLVARVAPALLYLDERHKLDHAAERARASG